MARYPFVLLDLDGTLIDSIRLILDSYHHTFATHGLAPQSDAHFLAGIGITLRTTLSAWAADDAALDALVATYRAYNYAEHDARVRAYPGVVDALHALHAGGARLALVTSKNRQGAGRGLAVAGIADLFDAVVSSDDVTRPKPDREPVDRALALLGGRREEAVFIGDSLHDLHSGRAAGVATGAALWGPFRRDELGRGEPSHWLESPHEMVALVLG